MKVLLILIIILIIIYVGTNCYKNIAMILNIMKIEKFTDFCVKNSSIGDDLIISLSLIWPAVIATAHEISERELIFTKGIVYRRILRRCACHILGAKNSGSRKKFLSVDTILNGAYDIRVVEDYHLRRLFFDMYKDMPYDISVQFTRLKNQLMEELEREKLNDKKE